MFSAWEPLTIPFVGGLDTKTDGKLVAPPRLVVCQNAIFTKHGTLKRRDGYTAIQPIEVDGTSITSYRGVATRADELLLQSDDKLFSFDALRDRYLERGTLPLCNISQEPISSTNSAQTFADACTLNDVTVVAWEDSRGGVYASAYNASTGAAYVTEQLISADGQGPMVVAYAQAIHIFFYNSNLDNIEMVRVNLVDVATSIATAAVVVRSDANTSSGVFDVVGYGQYAYLAYLTDAATTVKLARVTSAGAATVADVAANANVIAVAVATDGTSVFVAQLWDTGDDLDLHWFSPDLVAVGSSLAVRTGGNDRTRVTLAAQAGVATIFYQQPETAIGSFTPTTVNAFTYTLATATASSDTAFRQSKLASRPLIHDGVVYVGVQSETTFQSCYFLVRADGVLCGRSNYGLASGQSTRTRLPTVQDLNDGVFQWAPRIKRRLDVDPNQKLSAAYTHDTATIQTIDFGADFVYVESGGATYVPGGFLWQYDGASPVEAGFLMFPENVLLAGNTTGNALDPAKQYQYRCYWEWTNAAGERERSAALPYTIYPTGSGSTPAFGATDDGVTITVPTLWHTRKASPRSNAALVVYRTEGNGTTFHRCSSTDPTATGANGWVNNSTAANSVSFSDAMTDAVLVTKELDYQNTGELENVAPQTGSLVARSQSRLFVAGGTIRPDTVLYSKLRTTGQAAGRFNETLTIRVDEQGGPVTALAEMNGAVIIFKRDRIYATQPGELGASNLGVGGYSVAQLLTSDVGCSKPKTVCVTPVGLVFAADKGIYLLEQNFSVRFLGAEVESFGTADIVDATALPLQNTIVFLTSGGTALIYDYMFGQWGTWTSHTGVSSVLWNNALTWLATDGRVMLQTSGLYADDGVAYQLRARTAPIRPANAGVQGYWRAQRFQLLGEYKSSHSLHIDIYRNREDHPIQQEVFEPDDVLNLSTWGSGTWGSGAWGGAGRREYKFDCRIENQKVETLSFEFWDTPGTEVGAGYELSEITLKWAPKTGLGQVAATRKL
jgi:hypothetical protein